MPKTSDGRMIDGVILTDLEGTIFGGGEVGVPLPVEISGAAEPLTINVDTGSIVAATLGDVDDAKVTDPDAASATIPALLRGILAELQAQTALLDDIKTNTTPVE